MHLAAFNSASPADAALVVGVWAAIPRWVDAVVAARPYASVADAEAVADAAARRWATADLDAALAHHPRIGQRVSGSDAGATASRLEQASMTDAGAQLVADMAQANADYEDRFGRVFLIRAAGRTAEEMLSEAQRRLGNDDDTEASEAQDQLRQIALLRLRTALTEEES